MKTNAVAGDLVEIHLSKVIYEGVLLESPESGIVLLKLDSGYNIGFNKKDILDIKLLERAKEVKEEFNIKKDSKKPNIAMVICGGTIASRLDAKKGGVTPLDSPEDLFKFYPGVFDKVNVLKVETPFSKDSSEINSKDWQKLAKTCKELLEDENLKGIIVTHGTDTLHYTASALSFFLGKVNKPVVLTYSQRSTDRASSDATLNLQCSALAAISDIAEVMVVGHASNSDDFCYAIAGTKVRKMHSSKRDAFKSINRKPFAKISENHIEILSEYNLRNKHKIKPLIKFEEKVTLIKFYPGQEPSILDYYIKEKYKGIVLEMFGLGQIDGNWIKKLKEIQDKGIIVCATSQTIYGRVDPLVYSIGRELMKTGVVYLKDMLSETAFVKLGWVLGQTSDKKKIKEMMLENYAHEFNDRLEK